MIASTTSKLRRTSKPLRGAAIALAVVGVAFAGNSALGLAGDDAGRDGSTVPGAPSDAPTPIDDSDTGRDGATTPAPSSRSAEAPALGAISDNGRGFDDPASGPNPVARQSADSSGDASAAYDTDSGEAPVADATTAPGARESSGEAPADQDVPGAPTGGADGTDAPSDDQDG